MANSACSAAALAAALARRFCFLRFTAGAVVSSRVAAWEDESTPLEEVEVVVGEGWAAGVAAVDFGTEMYFVPSLLEYFDVALAGP